VTGVVAEVSRSALQHNIRLLRERVSPARLLAVIKDDAYGHGASFAVEVLRGEGVDHFGTLELAPAVALKQAFPECTLFAWVFDSRDELAPAIAAGVDLGITDFATLERAADAAASAQRPAMIHLKLDTGLHRAGALAGDWPSFVARAAQLQTQARVQVRGLWTHLAEASDDDDSRSIAEYRDGVAVAAAQGIEGVTRHVAASAASYFREDSRFDMVRIGAFLYGIAPGGGIGATDLGLVPVMTLRAPIIATEVRDSRTLAVLGIGGSDGILSDAAGAVSVTLAGRRYPVVSVDPFSMTVDVTGGSASPGDLVTLFGRADQGEPTLQEWADAMGTIGEEIVTRLSGAIPRRYVA